jgi:hypothetical protein
MSMREAVKRGAPIEIDDFERRLRSEQPRRGTPPNPLRELARLMQSEEQVQEALRYARMFGEKQQAQEEPEPDYGWRPAKRARTSEQAIHAAVSEVDDQPPPAWGGHPAPIDEHDLPPPLRGPLEAPVEEEAYLPDDAAHAHHYGYEPHPHGHAPQHEDAHYADDAHIHEGYDEEHYAAADYAAARGAAPANFGVEEYAFTPRGRDQRHPGPQAEPAWAEEDSQWAGEPPPPSGRAPQRAKRRGFSFPNLRVRPWHAIAAAAVVGLGGVGWGVAHIKGKVGSRDIATIAAPSGPVKVAPSAQTEAAPASQSIAVLDRQENTQVRQIETHQEQPVEPVVELPANPPRDIAPSLETKRVKTLSIRNGAPVETTHAPAAVERAARPAAPADVATTPKAAAKPTTTGQAAAKPKPKPKAVATAEPEDAGDAPASTAKVAGGSFAVQFGAAQTEAEARALMSKVAQKYGGQLGGHRPTFKMATVGDKTVYRVRVGGVSKESATSICGAVKSSGGQCFVAGN